MLKNFKTAGYGNLRCIIDSSEVFIEKPKKTWYPSWLDYKSHNTVKFFIGISPTGLLTFLSDTYVDTASDKFIVVIVAFLTTWIVMMKL